MSSLDRNAANSERLRRNAQRGRSSGTTGAVKVVAPLSNTGSQIQLLLLSTGGITTNTGSLTLKLDTNPGLSLSAAGLKMLLADTSMQLAAGGVSVRTATNAGLTVSTGLLINLAASSGLQLVTNALSIKPTDTSLTVAAGGVSVALATNSGLQIATGLTHKLDGTSLQLGANGIAARGFYTTAPVTPADGDAWYDTTAKCVTIRQDGVTQKVGALLDVTTADAAAVVNTLVETTVYTYTFPANYFTVGKGFFLDFVGVYSTDAVAAAPALQIQVKIAGVVFYSTGVVTVPQGAAAFRIGIDASTVCRATGNPASFGRDGAFEMELTSVGTGNFFKRAGGSATSAGDTTATIALTITAAWNTANANDTFTMHQVVLRSMD